MDGNNGGDSGVELLSLYPSKGCDMHIPDMPLAAGSDRRFHNLACNGMTNKNESSCDMWSVGNNTWKHHTNPNKADPDDEKVCHTVKEIASSNIGTNVARKGRKVAMLLRLYI